MTPEGVPIQFTLADIGQRVNAFLIDMLVIIGLTLLVIAPAVLVAAVDLAPPAIGFGLAYLAVFFLWNFYFAWFELNWQGATPGKRRVGIRTIDATGGPASADAVIARNLVRDIEFFLPLAGAIGAAASGSSGWLVLGAVSWLFVFALLPLFNRDRLRVGDLVAGTIVVLSPKAGLLRDLSEKPAQGLYTFSTEQLDVYGIYELQVLEDVLRGDTQAHHGAAVHTVARKVMSKIRWSGTAVEPEPFLRAFYAALRARLEHRLLYGKRREDKHDR